MITQLLTLLPASKLGKVLALLILMALVAATCTLGIYPVLADFAE